MWRTFFTARVDFACPLGTLRHAGRPFVVRSVNDAIFYRRDRELNLQADFVAGTRLVGGGARSPVLLCRMSALLLIVSGLTKLIMPASPPSLFINVVVSGLLVIIGVGAFILSRQSATPAFLGFLFGLFASVNIAKVAAGEVDCHCFGMLHPDIRIVAAVDVVLAVMLGFRVRISLSHKVIWLATMVLISLLLFLRLDQRVFSRETKRVLAPSHIQLIEKSESFIASFSVSSNDQVEVIGCAVSCPCLVVTPKAFQVLPGFPVTIQVQSNRQLAEGGKLIFYLANGELTSVLINSQEM